LNQKNKEKKNKKIKDKIVLTKIRKNNIGDSSNES
jgi:hypothetical protein